MMRLFYIVLVALYPVLAFGASQTVDTSTWSCQVGEVARIDSSTGTVTCIPAPLIYRGAISPAGAFTYNGEGAGSCSGDVCRGGTCSGTSPNGVCTLPTNIPGLHPQDDFSENLGSPDLSSNHVAEYHYTSFTLTGGTVTVSDPPAADYGVGLAIYVSGDVNITGGKIDLKGKGAQSNTTNNGGSCASGQAGKSGVGTLFFQGDGGGSTAGTENATSAPNALAPTSVFTAIRYFLDPYPHVGGAGGSITTSTNNLLPEMLGMSTGAGGGGGAGCLSGCSGTAATAGNGGGAVKMLVNGTYTCSSPAEIDVSGTNAINGGGGGGGGGGTILVLTNNVGTNTCTYTVNGGLGSSTPPTGCGTGGNGGNGWSAVFDLSY